MSGYTVAWLIIAMAGVGGALALFTLLRDVRWSWLRLILVAGALGFFLTPAPVPEYSGHWAPAFVVVVFEAFFQTEGTASVGLRLLLLGTLLTVGMAAGVHVAAARFLPASDDESEREN